MWKGTDSAMLSNIHAPTAKGTFRTAFRFQELREGLVSHSNDGGTNHEMYNGGEALDRSKEGTQQGKTGKVGKDEYYSGK